ncbi:hypothetical protein [Burkholderia stagnalis]|uniref:hypothetical protein n=1 Tax=Burkholderia stagnalis TaxID=1503054 RepID=UPI00075CDA99|nr:hypothetical protein [Burkholderia stagnalis]KVC65921.1 hypothetical protein WS59_13805 [Burkholderia stagnalis]KVN16039.1 hypothetical protein WT10_22035 [Burkholderia stagnalis]KWI66932.1 hypothetical protein WT75_24940 [Burkholderia stagnalis]KWK16736.1 hypothetical protein WT77_29020 [Burkholderia stagnalis]KWK62277.1 hypothetical protein WT82_25290 [Burkholderia stagnalis]
MKPFVIFLVAAALTGCAQLQSGRPDVNARNDASSASTALVDFVIPADALGARDPQLTAVLAKVGALAARQSQPMTIRVAALPQDFGYLNQSIRRGMPSQRIASVRVENVAAGSCKPYSVQLGPTQ